MTHIEDAVHAARCWLRRPKVYADRDLPFDHAAREACLQQQAHEQRAWLPEPPRPVALPSIPRQRRLLADLRFYTAFGTRRDETTEQPRTAA